MLGLDANQSKLLFKDILPIFEAVGIIVKDDSISCFPHGPTCSDHQLSKIGLLEEVLDSITVSKGYRVMSQ